MKIFRVFSRFYIGGGAERERNSMGAMADDEFIARMQAALAGCTRFLSGGPRGVIADQLALLADSGYELDREPDVYGNGMVAELESRVADLLGKPAAAFFPTGTMAQQIALRIWAAKSGNPTVALHPLHHTEVHERKAFSTLSGLRSIWPTTQPRQPSAEEIRALDEPFSTLVIELPLREPGFVLPTWDELTAMCDAGRERGAFVHFDGARLWESAPHFGQDLPTIAGLADSVYVSFYKSLGGLAGAVLAGDEEFVQTAKAWRHRHGGQVFTQWPTVLSALVGLDRELPRLPEYVAHAKTVAAALAALPGMFVTPDPPHTHQFQVWLPYPVQALREASLALAEDEKVRFIGGWYPQAPGDRCMAEVTISASALEWSAQDLTNVGSSFLKRVTG